LEAFGVCTELLQVDATSSSACAITALEPSGERSIVYLPMPPAPISFGLDDVLRQARMLYLMPYDEDMLVQVSRVARQAGAQVVIDLEEAVAPDAAGMWRRIEQADLVFFNEAGFLAAVGEPPGEASLRGVQRAGPKTIVVTLGASGALAVDGDSFARQSAFAVTVADTTGAGDTFNAAFLVSRMEKMSLQQSLLFACAAASCAVTAVGARTGMPDITRVANVLAAAAN
jgi:ribokinase/sulfofructose kinase